MRNWKRMMICTMAVCLLAALLPVTALAADKPKLVMYPVDSAEYWEEWDPYGRYREHFYPALLIDGQRISVDPAALYSSDEAALTVIPSTEYEGAVYLVASGESETEVRYDHSDGKTYSFKVDAPVLPTIGVYSKPEANGANHLSSFTARNGDNTIYLILRDGWIAEDVSFEYFAEDCSFVLSPDKTMAAITIGPNSLPPAYPYLIITVVDDLGFRKEAIHRFDLTTDFSDLYFRYPAWENGPVEDPSCEPQRAWYGAKGDQTICHFYCYDGTVETLLTAENLRSTNEDVLCISPYGEESAAVQMELTGFGTAEIVYEQNGITYSMPITSALPDYGFYTASVSSEAAYIEDSKGIQITAENRTVYLVLGAGIPDHTIASVDLFEDAYNPFPEGSFCTIVADGRSAAITIGKGSKGISYYSLYFELNIPDTNTTDLYSRRLVVERSEDMDVPAMTPTPAPAENPFTDVKESDWYYEPVMWAKTNGITGGLTETSFGPNENCTRAQVVTFLWASNGKPEPTSGENPFTDVKESDWFYNPVLWAVENGITGGLTQTTFGPNTVCTRAQVVTFLWAAAGKPEPAAASTAFTDVKESDWFYKPVLWAVENGITSGLTPATFGANNQCTRGQIVTFLYAAEEPE